MYNHYMQSLCGDFDAVWDLLHRQRTKCAQTLETTDNVWKRKKLLRKLCELNRAEKGLINLMGAMEHAVETATGMDENFTPRIESELEN